MLVSPGDTGGETARARAAWAAVMHFCVYWIRYGASTSWSGLVSVLVLSVSALAGDCVGDDSDGRPWLRSWKSALPAG